MARKAFRRHSDILLGHIELDEKQRAYHKIITDPTSRIIFLNGPAGSAKTFLSFYSALSMHNEDKELKILYLRTVVECASKSLGFLKGSEENKLEPYLEPMQGILSELLNDNERQQIETKKTIQGAPINFLRGRNFNNEIVILDEANNATFKEILTAITRLNRNSKIIVAGDPDQCDIRDSGFQQLYDIFDDDESKTNGIHCLKLDLNDIKRDPVVKYILEKTTSRRLE